MPSKYYPTKVYFCIYFSTSKDCLTFVTIKKSIFNYLRRHLCSSKWIQKIMIDIYYIKNRNEMYPMMILLIYRKSVDLRFADALFYVRIICCVLYARHNLITITHVLLYKTDSIKDHGDIEKKRQKVNVITIRKIVYYNE